MIYTLTLNPSLDYLVEMEKLMPGKINRADSEEIFYGGKGVNVSIMLKHLNVDSIALGFTAGVTAELFENGVRSCGVTPSFLRVKNGFTRINVKILDEEETEDDVADLQQDKADEDEDVLEVSSLYPYLSTSFIAQTLSRNEEFNTNFPEDTLVSVLHTCQFDDMRSLLNFEAIMADAGYISQHDDNLEVRSAKRFFSEEGAIISDILNVANQAAALDGRYIDCELN